MQTWATLGLMMFFLALFVHVQPYHNPVLNRLELYALTADLLTLFLGLGLFNNGNAGEMKSDGFAQIFSILVVVVNVLFIVYMLYVVWNNSEYLQKARVWKKERKTWVNNPLPSQRKRSESTLKRAKRLVELHKMRESISV